MKRDIAYNCNITDAFYKLIIPFLNDTKEFSYGQYKNFFQNVPDKEISNFFTESQKFINNLVYHIHSIERGKNHWSRYFLDLIVLLGSNLLTLNN